MNSFQRRVQPSRLASTDHDCELSGSKIQMVANFARFADQTPSVRQQLHQATSLDHVVQIAHAHGFTEIKDELLERATKRVMSCDWIWQESGSRWSDHVFILSLITITLWHLNLSLDNDNDGKHSDRDDGLLIEDEKAIDRDLELKTFYEYACITAEIQEEFSKITSADEAVAIAKSHGFLIRKSDFLLNMCTHGSFLRPWMCGDQSQRLRNTKSRSQHAGSISAITSNSGHRPEYSNAKSQKTF